MLDGAATAGVALFQAVIGFGAGQYGDGKLSGEAPQQHLRAVTAMRSGGTDGDEVMLAELQELLGDHGAGDVVNHHMFAEGSLAAAAVTIANEQYQFHGHGRDCRVRAEVGL